MRTNAKKFRTAAASRAASAGAKLPSSARVCLKLRPVSGSTQGGLWKAFQSLVPRLRMTASAGQAAKS